MKTLYIHQIYGLFDDGKEMPELFKQSYLKYSYIAFNNNRWDDRKYNYEYKLWDKKACEELLKKYGFVKNYYDKVRYKIMKVDIMRFVILYEYGGIYSDMDIIPKIYNLDFILDNENNEYISHYYWTPQKKGDKIVMDMEIIGCGNPKNILFLNYLLHIPNEIEEKNKMEIYNSWKIRYVFQTTGPPSFRRFLKKNKCDKNIRPLIVCGIKKGISFKDEFNKENYGNIDYEFLSYFSLSYKQDIHGNKNVEYKKKK